MAVGLSSKDSTRASTDQGSEARPPVGSPMEWRFLQTAPGVVVSEGLGYGREPFQLRWRKLP